MGQFQSYDVMLEVFDLCHETLNDIQHQLLYYQASVYKDETANIISQKINQLQVFADVLYSGDLQEVLLDFAAMSSLSLDGNSAINCSFSVRVAHLLRYFRQALVDIETKHSATYLQENKKFRSIVKNKQSQILAVCRHGSRQWNFFRNL
ncbi:MAG: hypothetical protein KBD78_03725 [Oligoflexales bacterium]|nr:hypothetical protein [Oligoflexales bacterium]